ncbi:MAG: flagellar biosynthetic protein FliR [Terricaulis sp.]
MNAAIASAASTLTAAMAASLRIAPTLAFAPPFTLMRVPLIARVALAMGLSIWLVTSVPLSPAPFSQDRLAATIAGELLLGLSLSLSLQIAFAALATAGRVIDFQTGFGFALLVDPSLRTQMPLVGTLLAYGAGAIFFSTSAPVDFLAVWARSFIAHPIGGDYRVDNLSPLLAYIGTSFFLAFGLAGLVMAGLFVADLAIAFMSRTLPQMNVLMLGFQVKTALLLLMLPFVFAYAGAGFLRLLRFALENAGQLT